MGCFLETHYSAISDGRANIGSDGQKQIYLTLSELLPEESRIWNAVGQKASTMRKCRRKIQPAQRLSSGHRQGEWLPTSW